MTRAFLGIGGNLGRRDRFIQAAIQRLAKFGDVVKVSRLYETEPWKMNNAPDFLNGVIELHTGLSPEDLMLGCLEIERQLGRKRSPTEGYASRTIDIDLLYFGNRVQSSPFLTLPHPGIANRRFVLLPLAEIAATFIDPVRECTIAEMLKSCTDNSESLLWHSPTATLA
jgi:2-amino-4-hydroxy-6-hydroxymethyldihydropteridine diphosphokinase